MSNMLMAPYASQILGDMGTIFLHTNRGKRSIVLDLKQDAGRQTIKQLLAQKAKLQR